MKAFAVKTPFFKCRMCGDRHEVGSTNWWSVDGASIQQLRNQFPITTAGVPDEMFEEVSERDGVFTETYTVLDVLVCPAQHAVAQWNKYMEETLERKISQIENYPLNRAKLTPLYQCGHCGGQQWDSDTAEECCL